MRLTKFFTFFGKTWWLGKFFLSEFWRLGSVKLLILAALFFNLAAWFLAWLIIARLPDGQTAVILHYNVLFGIDFIGERWQVWLLPFYGLLICLGNNLLAVWLYGRDRLAAQLVCAAAAAANLFLSLALLTIYLINSL